MHQSRLEQLESLIDIRNYARPLSIIVDQWSWALVYPEFKSYGKLTHLINFFRAYFYQNLVCRFAF